jgi:hypothetical protein
MSVKGILRPLIAVLIGVLVYGKAAALPIVYEYSYTFNDGTVVSGTLMGEPVGGFVANVSAITLFVNGASQPGPFFLYGRDAALGWLTTAGKVAFDGSLNNLLFGNDPPPLDGPSEYFYYVNSQQWCGSASSCTLVSVENPHFDSSDLGSSANRWTLRAVSAPEPSISFPLLLGLLILAFIRSWGGRSVRYA